MSLAGKNSDGGWKDTPRDGQNLRDRVSDALKKRVDPIGNLACRPEGDTALGVSEASDARATAEKDAKTGRAEEAGVYGRIA